MSKLLLLLANFGYKKMHENLAAVECVQFFLSAKFIQFLKLLQASQSLHVTSEIPALHKKYHPFQAFSIAFYTNYQLNKNIFCQ